MGWYWDSPLVLLVCVGQMLIILSCLCSWVSDGVPVLKMPLVLLGDLTVGTFFFLPKMGSEWFI